MRSQISKFRFFDKGAKETMVLIPGWAADYRIFRTMDVNANCLMPVTFFPFGFEESLLAGLKENGISQVSIFGWSMGAYLAVDFASRHPGAVTAVFAVSARERYEETVLSAIRDRVTGHRAGYLSQFYRMCFTEKEALALSRANRDLLKAYCREMTLDNLLSGLDYLSCASLRLARLKGIPICFIHGSEDAVAPIGEVRKMSVALPQAELISLEGAGHIPFLNRSFDRILHG